MTLSNGPFVAEIEPVSRPRKLFRYTVYRLPKIFLYEGYTAEMAEAEETAQAHLFWLAEQTRGDN